MNKIRFGFAFVLALVFLNSFGQSQQKQDYFVGKWEVLVEGTPQGDAKMIVSLERKGTTLNGAIFDTANVQVATIDSVGEKVKDSSIVVYFKSQGFDVFLALDRKDEDHSAGNLMDMFDASAIRVKNNKLSPR